MDGLPLGLLSAPWRFQDASLWLCPELWVGRRGIKRLTKSILVFSLVLTCTLLASFSGPSSAVLMIPHWVTNWPGGGATFNIIGDNSILWRDELLTAEPCRRSRSQDGSQAISELINDTCASSSAVAIAQALQGWMFEDVYYPIDVTDGLVHRKITLNIREKETWAITPQLAPCVISRVLSLTWRTGAIISHATDAISSSYAKYRYREKKATVTMMESQVPIVRVSCSMYALDSSLVELLDPTVSSFALIFRRQMTENRCYRQCIVISLLSVSLRKTL